MTEPEAPQKPAKDGFKTEKTVIKRKKSGEIVIIKPPAEKNEGDGKKPEQEAETVPIEERKGPTGLTTSKYLERVEGKTCPILKLTDEGVALITAMYGYGSTQAEVAAVLGISPDVLQNRVNAETDRRAREIGSARWAQEIRVQQRAILRQGDTKMAIWLGKQVLGQQDRIDVSATVTEVSDASALTYDEAIGLLEQVAGKRLRAEAKKARAREARRRKASEP